MMRNSNPWLWAGMVMGLASLSACDGEGSGGDPCLMGDACEEGFLCVRADLPVGYEGTIASLTASADASSAYLSDPASSWPAFN